MEAALATANRLLSVLGITDEPLVSVEELQQNASSTAVAVCEAALGVRLDAIRRHPESDEDYAHNAQVVIDTLRTDVLPQGSVTVPVTGAAIAAGEPAAVSYLLSLLDDVHRILASSASADAAVPARASSVSLPSSLAPVSETEEDEEDEEEGGKGAGTAAAAAPAALTVDELAAPAAPAPAAAKAPAATRPATAPAKAAPASRPSTASSSTAKAGAVASSVGSKKAARPASAASSVTSAGRLTGPALRVPVTASNNNNNKKGKDAAGAPPSVQSSSPASGSTRSFEEPKPAISVGPATTRRATTTGTKAATASASLAGVASQRVAAASTGGKAQRVAANKKPGSASGPRRKPAPPPPTGLAALRVTAAAAGEAMPSLPSPAAHHTVRLSAATLAPEQHETAVENAFNGAETPAAVAAVAPGFAPSATDAPRQTVAPGAASLPRGASSARIAQHLAAQTAAHNAALATATLRRHRALLERLTAHAHGEAAHLATLHAAAVRQRELDFHRLEADSVKRATLRARAAKHERAVVAVRTRRMLEEMSRHTLALRLARASKQQAATAALMTAYAAQERAAAADKLRSAAEERSQELLHAQGALAAQAHMLAVATELAKSEAAAQVAQRQAAARAQRDALARALKDMRADEKALLTAVKRDMDHAEEVFLAQHVEPANPALAGRAGGTAMDAASVIASRVADTLDTDVHPSRMGGMVGKVERTMTKSAVATKRAAASARVTLQEGAAAIAEDMEAALAAGAVMSRDELGSSRASRASGGGFSTPGASARSKGGARTSATPRL